MAGGGWWEKGAGPREQDEKGAVRRWGDVESRGRRPPPDAEGPPTSRPSHTRHW